MGASSGHRSRALEGALALVVAVIAVAILRGAADQPGPVPQPTPDPDLFPGGGMLLVAAGETLRWVEAAGPAHELTVGVDGGVLNETGTAVLAWRPTAVSGATGRDYLVLDPDDGQQQFDLPAEPRGTDRPVKHGLVTMSPNGGALAYVRSDLGRDDLHVVLDTGVDRRVMESWQEFVWMPDSSGLAVAGPGGTSVVAVPLEGPHSVIASVLDADLRSAFAAALPGHVIAGLVPISWSPDGSALAMLATDRGRSPAAALMVRTRHGTAAYPLGTRVAAGQDLAVEMRWGPDGLFLVALREPSSFCCPSRWGQRFLEGNLARPGELHEVLRTVAQYPIASGPVVSPDGSTMAVQLTRLFYLHEWLFLPLGKEGPPCDQGRDCRGTTTVTDYRVIGELGGWVPA